MFSRETEAEIQLCYRDPGVWRVNDCDFTFWVGFRVMNTRK